MLFEIEYDVILKNDKRVHYKELGFNIESGNYFQFTRCSDGAVLIYTLHNCEPLTSYKTIENIKITQTDEND